VTSFRRKFSSYAGCDQSS